jgi:hypothetical protein
LKQHGCQGGPTSAAAAAAAAAATAAAAAAATAAAATAAAAAAATAGTRASTWIRHGGQPAAAARSHHRCERVGRDAARGEHRFHRAEAAL